jgi:uncharacterized LabA/DUF88 family protein
MAESADGRVAVYIDFDNIVISRYDQVHGRNQFQRDKAKSYSSSDTDEEVGEKLAQATVDIGAVIDFASSFGTLVLTRAYADWSTPVNADYRGQLVGRSVDLVQLFPAAAYGKNGADIRLAVDAVEDMFRLSDLTHIVIVAGDSDYIALAQRCKRLGRYVVGIGVAGSTARSLAAACDDFATYDTLPGVEAAPVEPVKPAEAEPAPAKKEKGGDRKEESAEAEPARKKRGARRAQAPATAIEEDPEPEVPEDPQEIASNLLERALRLGHERDDAEWLHSSQVKTQIKRMDPSFSEKALGYRSFSEFVKSRPAIAELDESSTARFIRLV